VLKVVVVTNREEFSNCELDHGLPLLNLLCSSYNGSPSKKSYVATGLMQG